jgi:ankyrin repeat protein/CRP-like cAMP-binding protein
MVNEALLRSPLGVRSFGSFDKGVDLVDYDKIIQNGTILPWNPSYRLWWNLTAFGAIFTAFLTPYQIAFEEDPGFLKQSADVLEKVLTLIFTVDIMVNFNLAFFRDDEFVFERNQIAREYLSFMFWVDVVGVIPFGGIVYLVADQMGASSETILILSLVQFSRFVRLYRIKKLSVELRNNLCVNLLTFTLLRNFAVVVVACHVQACVMYFLARARHFGSDTWLGPILYKSESSFERYVTSLYWSITTFCTVGYGDFRPMNPVEKVFGSIFMLVNIVVAAWIIGSITLLMLTGDNKTREYRESLEILDQYGYMHKFDQILMNKLKKQLKLEFDNREFSDDMVLKYFPSAVRRKILRQLYHDHLAKTDLMKGVRPQFVDAFLASCSVEIFGAGEEIVERGSILSDLFLLVGGIAEITTSAQTFGDVEQSSTHSQHTPTQSTLQAGEFIGELGFFTDSPQIHSVVSVTVCKTLTMSRSNYKLLTQDHPGSVGKILQNLLSKVERASMQAQLPKSLEELRIGGSTLWYANGSYQSLENIDENHAIVSENSLATESLTVVKDLVQMHMDRNHDDQTTRLLFAASRGDTRTIHLNVSHGLDPNSHDYDHRTALMVSSMKGNFDVVKLLLQFGADPNILDMHGSSALLEATKNGHDDIMNLLFEYEASLCMPDSQAASVLCQAVYDGDILLIKRLLKAGINVNAADYDKRTASHIAAAEGNAVAIRILAENGADLTLADRWGNTVHAEAERRNKSKLFAFLGGN